MIEVFSYLQHTKAERYGIWVSEIGEFPGQLARNDPNYEVDSSYVRGAIELIIDGEYLFTKENSFDCIVMFWWTLINLAEDMTQKDNAIGYYPSNAIDIQARAKGEYHCEISLKVSFERKPFKRIVVAKSEFWRAIYDGAERFFRCMIKIHPVEQNRYEEDLERLAKLQPLLYSSPS